MELVGIQSLLCDLLRRQLRGGTCLLSSSQHSAGHTARAPLVPEDSRHVPGVPRMQLPTPAAPTHLCTTVTSVRLVPAPSLSPGMLLLKQ